MKLILVLLINLNLPWSARNSTRTIYNIEKLSAPDREIGIWGITKMKSVRGFVALLCRPLRYTRIYLVFKTQVPIASTAIRAIIRPNSNFYRMKYRCCDFSQLAVIHFAVRDAKRVTNLLRNRHFYRINNFTRH